MARATSTVDVEVIVPENETVTLSTGSVVHIQPLKARQFFKLLRIITHGAGGMLLNIQFSPNDTPEAFGAKLLALVGFAIPDAEDEVIEFLLSMVEPDGIKSGKNITKADRENNKALVEELVAEMDNPELEDLVTLVEAIVNREAADLQALGKRLMTMFDLAKKTGQIPTEMTAKE